MELHNLAGSQDHPASVLSQYMDILLVVLDLLCFDRDLCIISMIRLILVDP